MRPVRQILVLGCCVFLIACGKRPEEKAADFMAAGQRLHDQRDYARAILQFRNAIQALPRKAEPHHRLALALLAQNDGQSAVAELKKAIGIDPQHAGAQLLLARILVASPNTELVAEAEKRIQQLLSSGPQDKEVWNALAVADWQLGKRAQAERRFEDALRRFPDNLRASVAIAQLKLSRRDFAGAEEVLKNAAAQAPANALPLVALGEFYTLRESFPQAEECLRRAMEMEPKNSLPGLELMTLQMRRGEVEEARATYARLASAHGDQYRAAYAALLFDAGSQNEAIAEFEKLAAVDPQNRDTRTWLIRAYMRSNRQADAERLLSGALKRNSRDVDALLQRSILRLRAGDYAAAQSDAAQVVHYRSDSAQAHYVLAKVHTARGAMWGARQEFNEALRIAPGFLPARIDLAQTYMVSGDGKLALKIMNETPAADRDKPAALLARNWALAAAGEMEELRASVKKLLSLNPAPDALLQQALLQFNDRDFAGGRASINRALGQNPLDIRALNLLARSYALENREAEAAKTLRNYAAAHPQSAAVQQLWGQWALEHGHRDEAAKAFEAALAATPRFAPAALALAGIDLAAGRTGAARSRLTTLLSESQNIPAMMMIADIDVAANRSEAALAAYQKVLASEPDNLTALNNAAYLLVDHAKQPDEALQYAQRAQQLSPDNPAIEDTLGWILYAKGLYAGALPHLKRAAEAGTHQRFYHLGMTYIKMGDYQNGRKALQRALETGTHLPHADKIREALTSVGP